VIDNFNFIFSIDLVFYILEMMGQIFLYYSLYINKVL